MECIKFWGGALKVWKWVLFQDRLSIQKAISPCIVVSVSREMMHMISWSRIFLLRSLFFPCIIFLCTLKFCTFRSRIQYAPLKSMSRVESSYGPDLFVFQIYEKFTSLLLCIPFYLLRLPKYFASSQIWRLWSKDQPVIFWTCVLSCK